MWQFSIWEVFTVYIPRIFASKLCLFFLKCSPKAGSLSKYILNSPPVIVFMMNLLSCEKKKKLPERPAPSPALNTHSLLYLGLRLAWKLASWSWKSFLNISLNKSILWQVTFMSCLITTSSYLGLIISSPRLKWVSFTSHSVKSFIFRELIFIVMSSSWYSN